MTATGKLKKKKKKKTNTQNKKTGHANKIEIYF